MMNRMNQNLIFQEVKKTVKGIKHARGYGMQDCAAI